MHSYVHSLFLTHSSMCRSAHKHELYDMSVRRCAKYIHKYVNQPTSWSVERVRLLSLQQPASGNPPAVASQPSQPASLVSQPASQPARPASQGCIRASKPQASRHLCLQTLLQGHPIWLNPLPQAAIRRHRPSNPLAPTASAVSSLCDLTRGGGLGPTSPQPLLQQLLIA